MSPHEQRSRGVGLESKRAKASAACAAAHATRAPTLLAAGPGSSASGSRASGSSVSPVSRPARSRCAAGAICGGELRASSSEIGAALIADCGELAALIAPWWAPTSLELAASSAPG